MTAPDDLERILRRITESFSGAELAVFVVLATAVKKNASPRVMRRQVAGVVRELQTKVRGELKAVLVAAAAVGVAKVVSQIKALPQAHLVGIASSFKQPSEAAIAALQRELERSVDAACYRILRYAEGTFRSVAAESVVEGLAGMEGEATRLKAAQAALDRFAMRGVTGFIDSADKNWNLASYVEMATRTATMNAERAASLAGFAQLGEDLVFINDSASACEECAPFEGEILSVSGENPKYTSLDEAEAAGLFHPNCGHTPSLWVEGLSTLPDASIADPERYAAEQRQRVMERTVRSWKTRSAGAADPLAQARADAKVKSWQAQLREHTAKNNLARKSGREQIGKAV